MSFPEPKLWAFFNLWDGLISPSFHLSFRAPRLREREHTILVQLRRTSWTYCSLSIKGCQLNSFRSSFVTSIARRWKEDNWVFHDRSTAQWILWKCDVLFCLWRVLSAGTRMTSCKSTDVSLAAVAEFILRFLLRFAFRPWRWRRYIPTERQLTFTGLHTTTEFFVVKYCFAKLWNERGKHVP